MVSDIGERGIREWGGTIDDREIIATLKENPSILEVHISSGYPAAVQGLRLFPR